MASAASGELVLADLSGYTRYLGGVELDHSHDVLADLIGVVADQLDAGRLRLVKLEGDCVFSAGQVDGASLRSTIETTYLAFRQRRRAIERATSCECDACRRIEDLDLKIVAHHGSWIEHDVAGRSELTGTAIITAHRLLKNSVTTDRAYALLSEALVNELDLEVSQLQPHLEHHDGQDIRCLLLDLEDRWQDHEARRPVLVAEGSADLVLMADVDAPSAVVFEMLTDPAHQRKWRVGLTSYDATDPGGARGVGTVAHCAHGRTVMTQEIVDWRPPEYMSFRERNPLGRTLWTMELEPLSPHRTRMTWRMALAGGRGQRLLLRAAKGKLQRTIQANVDSFVAYVGTAR
jgi:uncharacterized protein YndB with AHSA1/START domain